MFDKLCYGACDSSKTRLGRKWRGSRSNAPIYHTFIVPTPNNTIGHLHYEAGQQKDAERGGQPEKFPPSPL